MRKLCIIAILLAAMPLSVFADELEDKALAYEQWFNEYHVSPYGGTGYVYFAAPDSEEIVHYAFSDSTIWTGAYLASESFRYAVTGSAEAKENAIRTVMALDTHLHVTQVPGFIARFAGPDEAPWNNGYTDHDRYVQGTGAWEGSFWVNNTSRDQYTGWFFGMAVAYDLIDDEETKEVIRDDVKEVIDELRDDSYWIIGENGLPTDAGPQVIGTMRVCWHLIAAHILDTPEYRELYEQVFENQKGSLGVSSFSLMNKYYQYYGFNLSHETFFNLLRLERNPERRRFYLDIFHTHIRNLVTLTHNVFFDDIYLANCERAGACYYYDETLADIPTQLADFQDPPVREVPLEIPDWPLDPFTVAMSALIDALDIRELIDIEPQTLDPRPVKWRCPRSFMWQKSPYNIDCPGGDGTEVYPGIDYMIAYWMGRYYNLVEPGNPNGIYWPPDEVGDDDADDDTAGDDDTSADDDSGDDDIDSNPPDSGESDDDDDDGCGCSS